MNYIREAVEYLKAYEDLLIARKHLSERIMMFKESLKSVKALSYSDMPRGSIKGAPDDTLVNKMFELDESIKLFDENEQAIKATEKSLDDLPEESRRIIQLCYIEGRTEIQILSQLNMSRRTFYRLKSQAIRIFAVQLFGIRAIS